MTGLVIKSYFAQWLADRGSSWTKIHWFRPKGEFSVPACGAMPPDEPWGFSLPPEPILTCESCIRAIRKRDQLDEKRKNE